MPEISILVKAKDQASKALKGIGKSVGGLTDKLGGMGVIGPAAIAGVGLAVGKLAWDAMELEPTRITFDNLTESIGSTADAMLEELRPATMGVVSDADLMASANKLISMGLAGNTEEAAKLSKMAVTLGTAMGKKATPAMEEFALMLANQSIPRLDTFGISAGKVRTRINELMEADKNLTREQAFMNAVMEQGEISMERVGDVSETTSMKMQRVGVAVAEAKRSIGEALIPILDAAAVAFLDTKKAIGDVIEEKEEIIRATYEVVETEKEFIDAMYDTLPPLIKQEILASETKKAVFDLAYAKEYEKKKSEELMAAVKPLIESFTDLEHEMGGVYSTAKDTGGALDDLAIDFEEYTEVLKGLQEAIREEMFPSESELREHGNILYQIYVEENPRVIAARSGLAAEERSYEAALTAAEAHADNLKAAWDDAKARLEETRAGMHGVPDAYGVQAITKEGVDLYEIEWEQAHQNVEALEEGHMGRMAALEAGIANAVDTATSPALEIYRTYLDNVEEAERLAAIGRAESWVKSLKGVAPDVEDILAEMVRDNEITLDQIPEAVREDVEDSLEEFKLLAIGVKEEFLDMEEGPTSFSEVTKIMMHLGASHTEIEALKMKRSLIDDTFEPAAKTVEDFRFELEKLDGTVVHVKIELDVPEIPSYLRGGELDAAIQEAGMYSE